MDSSDGKAAVLTLYFSRSSLERGALMIVRRTLDGALKCALRDFLREEWRAEKIVSLRVRKLEDSPAKQIALSIEGL